MSRLFWTRRCEVETIRVGTLCGTWNLSEPQFFRFPSLFSFGLLFSPCQSHTSSPLYRFLSCDDFLLLAPCVSFQFSESNPELSVPPRSNLLWQLSEAALLLCCWFVEGYACDGICRLSGDSPVTWLQTVFTTARVGVAKLWCAIRVTISDKWLSLSLLYADHLL